MAASYPAGFDTMSDPASNLSGPPLHSTMHNQINDVLEAIEAELGLNPSGTAATVAAVTAVTAWTAVTFTNSWVDLGGAGIQLTQYRKVGDMVHIRGYAKSGTIGQSMFTLPAGFRPPGAIAYSTVSNALFGSFNVNADGTVVAAVGSNASFAVNCQFSVTT